jgi:hypothetical protein
MLSPVKSAGFFAAVAFVLFGSGPFGGCSSGERDRFESDAMPPGAFGDVDERAMMKDAASDVSAAPDAQTDSSMAPLGPSPLGVPCEQDADCQDGLVCLLPDSDVWLGGGPAHGYCSLDCTADATRCASLDRYARCLTSTKMKTASYCFKSCLLGDPNGDKKCFDREDVSCVLVEGLPACLPNCGGDEDCPPERYCNHAEGVCMTGSEMGGPVGEDCDPFTANTCTAYCSSLGGGYGVCSGLCVLGADYACGVAADETNLAGAPLCVTFNPLDSPGDAGICVQRCRCNEDCDHPRAYCDFEADGATGELGLCLFDFEADAGTRGVSCGALDAAGISDAR